MFDLNWNKGYYYDGFYFKMGMKLVRFVIFVVLYGILWLLLLNIFCKKFVM